MHPAVRPLISVTLIALSVLGLINVYSDNADVEAQASSLACPGCDAHLRQIERTPLSQSFHFATEKSGVIVVECSRSAIFLGEYSCKKR